MYKIKTKNSHIEKQNMQKKTTEAAGLSKLSNKCIYLTVSE